MAHDRSDRFVWEMGDLVRVEEATVDAKAIADAANFDLVSFKRELGSARFNWTPRDNEWTVTKGGREHGDMKRLMERLKSGT